ncbi:MAG: DUF3108 domain-containing protein [Thiobacillaceae bacterium]|nr:DUF3108 domain-containing protein [Thiobacillaceae bacterium]
MGGIGTRHRLPIALLLSALLHLAAGGGIPWPVAAVPEPPAPPIAARLTPPMLPPEDLTPPAREPPSRSAPPAPGRVARSTPSAPMPAAEPAPVATPQPPVAEAPMAPPPPEPAPESSAGPTAPPPAPEPVPAPPPVPTGFTIRYAVRTSEDGYTLGRFEHVWQSDGERYALHAVARATGLMRLIYAGLLSQTSYGSLTAQGLRPEHYWLNRGQRQLRAHFDWERMQADLGADRGTLELRPGTQDLLSVLYQVSLFPPPGEGQIWVLDGKRLRAYEYRELGREVLDLPLGRMATRHLRVAAAGAEESFELWLRETWPQLPVKIRLLGHRQGDAVLLAEAIVGLSLAAE